MRGGESDQGVNPFFSPEPADIIPADQSPLGIADDRDPFKRKAPAQNFYFLRDMLGQAVNWIGIEEIEKPTEVERKNPKPILTQSGLQYGKASSGRPKAVEKKNRMAALGEIGFPFNFIGLAQGLIVGDEVFPAGLQPPQAIFQPHVSILLESQNMFNGNLRWKPRAFASWVLF